MAIKRTTIRMDLSRKSVYTSIGASTIKPSPSTIPATRNTTAASAFDLYNVEKDYKWYDYAGFYTASTVAGTTAVLLWAWDSTTPIYYDDYYGYGYAKTRSTDAPAASPITMPDGTKVQPAGENCPIRIFNRFAEQEQ